MKKINEETPRLYLKQNKSDIILLLVVSVHFVFLVITLRL